MAPFERQSYNKAPICHIGNLYCKEEPHRICGGVFLLVRGSYVYFRWDDSTLIITNCHPSVTQLNGLNLESPTESQCLWWR